MAQPFSRVYCVPESVQQDSPRLRQRLGRYCTAHLSKQQFELAQAIELETGVRVPWIGGGVSLDTFFQKAELRDVLDAITHIYVVLERSSTGRYYVPGWRSFVARALSEEHVPYAMESNGEVRYRIDEAYAVTRKATLYGLSSERWAASRAEFERAFEAMDREPADTNGAIRAMSAALESTTKVMLGDRVARVGPAEIERYMRPMVEEVYAGDSTAQTASRMFLKTYAEWVNSAHQYRHGQGSLDVVNAPQELAIAMLSTGASILRWLMQVDSVRQPAASA